MAIVMEPEEVFIVRIFTSGGREIDKAFEVAYSALEETIKKAHPSATRWIILGEEGCIKDC